MKEDVKYSTAGENSGKLQRLCKSGDFVVTAELGPPKGNNPLIVEKKASYLAGFVDAVNVTDNQTAIVRMSSIATAALLVRMGIEPVMQMVTRDRNRIAAQSDILGAAALGIKNVLCLSGDHQMFGNHPFCKGVYDIDSIQLVSILRTMRDEGVFPETGEKIDGAPDLFIGAADAPFSDPVEYRPYRLRKKIDAGAQFIQTQCIYDVKAFREYMRRVRDLGIHEKCFIIGGVMPLKSLAMARYMQQNVPGIVIPESFFRCLASAPGGKAGDEGIKICCDIISELRDTDGISGIHVMAVEWEHRVPEIIDKCGLLPRPLV